MKNLTLVIVTFFLSFNSFGQDIQQQTAPIVAEGKRLYKSEMASWYGTDIFVEKFKDTEKIGGYFSYSNNDVPKCIFFSKGEKPTVIGTISFDSTYNVAGAIADLATRDFTKLEFDLYTIRSVALKTINSDTLFKTYKNTNLNLIPMLSDGEKKVYVLTGPQNNGVVIFGNDYLLTFDNDNRLMGVKQLHKNIIVNEYGQKIENDGEAVGAMHSHSPETGEFITPTDICTLMLYEKFAKWKQYYISSQNYFSIWDCEKNQLLTMTRDAMEKIDKDQRKRRKND